MRALSRSTARGLWTVGRSVITVGVIAAVAMQVVRGDFFPPENSMSQYGVGPDGWIFTIAVSFFGLGSLIFAVAGRQNRPAVSVGSTTFLALWAVCMILMGIIPADANASMPSLAGRTHMILAGLALIALPLAGFIQFNVASSRPAIAVQIIGSILCVLSELSLVLLLLTNVDIDITGLGQRDAWALYQSISVVADVAIIFLMGAFLPWDRGEKPMAADNRL